MDISVRMECLGEFYVHLPMVIFVLPILLSIESGYCKSITIGVGTLGNILQAHLRPIL